MGIYDFNRNYSVSVDEDTLFHDKDIQFLLKDTDIDIFMGQEPRTVHEAQMIHEGFRRKKRKDDEYVPINEDNYKQLIAKSESKRKLRSKKLTGKYMGIDQKKGWILFQTPSQYVPMKKYQQRIALTDVKDMKYLKDLRPRDIANLLLSGDLRVYCSCPDFKYRYSYMAYHYKYGLVRENRFPKIRNPHLEGRMCKHLILVVKLMQTNMMSISKDMKNSRYYKRKLNDTDDKY